MKNKFTLLVYLVMGIGVLLIIIGLCLIIFTDIYVKNGVDGVFLIAGIIGAGLFLLLPAKIILTLQLMKKNDKWNGLMYVDTPVKDNLFNWGRKMTTRKKYSKEYKLDAVSQVLGQGYTRIEAAKSLKSIPLCWGAG